MASARIEKLKRALAEPRELRPSEITTAQEIIAFAEEVATHSSVAQHLADRPIIEELKERAPPSNIGPLFGGKSKKSGKKK